VIKESQLLPVVSTIDQWNIILTNRCNLHCVTCSYPDQRPHRFVRREVIQRHLDAMLDAGLTRVLLTGGEPCMHPHFDEIVEDLHEAGLEITLVTNGTYLRRHLDAIAGRLTRLIISMDGPDAETYADIRGARAFDHLVTLPALVRERSPETALTICVVIQRRNFRSLPDFLRLGKALDVDRVSFLAPDLVGMKAPVERGGAFGHLEPLDEERVEAVALTLDEVDELREEVLPAIEAIVAADPELGNDSIAQIHTYADYFEAFRRGRPRGDRRRCALPFREVVLDEKERFRFCFFMPEAWPARGVADPVNHEGVVAMRSEYLASDERLDAFCDMCVQAARAGEE
jgi:pyruvate-formate lyase-activating enzyme